MRAARIARVLWLVWAVLLFNVILDHVIVVAGRDYILAAKAAATSSTIPHHYVNMDDWMRPAVTRALWTASAAAGAVLAAGFLLLRAATVRTAR